MTSPCDFTSTFSLLILTLTALMWCACQAPPAQAPLPNGASGSTSHIDISSEASPLHPTDSSPWVGEGIVYGQCHVGFDLNAITILRHGDCTYYTSSQVRAKYGIGHAINKIKSILVVGTVHTLLAVVDDEGFHLSLCEAAFLDAEVLDQSMAESKSAAIGEHLSNDQSIDLLV